MSPFDTIVNDEQATPQFRRLFSQLYDVPEPILPLGRVMHWSSTIRRLGADVPLLDGSETLVCGGYFYNCSTRAPSADDLDAWIALAERRGVPALFVPTVRNSDATDALSERGFSRIPWFVEAIYERKEGVDADLRAQLGRKGYAALLSDVKRAETAYELRFYTKPELLADPSLLEETSRLHACNVEKYSHALNFYSEPILREILSGPLGERLLVALRRDRETGEAVQTSIAFFDLARSQMYSVVQGIDHARVRPGQNLYVAKYYQQLKYAEALGIREVNYGRGKEDHKRRLGANRFHLLNNWVRNSQVSIDAEVAQLTERLRPILGLPEVGSASCGAFTIE